MPSDVVQPGGGAAAEKEAGSHSLHRRYSLPENVNVSECTILYVGEESLALNNILMTHSLCPVRLRSMRLLNTLDDRRIPGLCV